MFTLALCTASAVALADPGSAEAPNLARVGSYTAGPSGSTHTLPGNVVVQLSPATRVRVAPSTKVPLKSGHPGTKCVTLHLLSGKLAITLPEGNPPRHSVLVRAPHRVSAIPTGGRSVVIAGPKGTTVANREGGMLAAVGNAWKPLSPGFARSIGSGWTGAPRPILGSPVVKVGQSLLLKPRGQNGSSSVTIAKPRGAVESEVTVHRIQARSRELVATFRTTKALLPVSGLQVGRYEIVARAVDAWGLSGKASAAGEIQVIEYALPPGAALHHGTVFLFPKQRIRLLGSKGLEMTYGSANSYFVPAPSDVGLGSQDATVARFRQERDGPEARLAMARRSSARITLHPTSAHWPSDLVEVTVELESGTGRRLPGTRELDALDKKVLVDGEVVAVTWRDCGGSLCAVLPPPETDGPWRVRVELADALGPIADHSTRILPDARVASK